MTADVFSAAALVASSIATGGMVADLAVWHPAKRTLTAADAVLLHQRSTKRADTHRPASVILAILSGIATLIAADGLSNGARACLIVGLVAWVGVGIVSGPVIGARQKQIFGWDPGAPPPDAPDTFDRWERAHAIRTALATVGLVAYAVGICAG